MSAGTRTAGGHPARSRPFACATAGAALLLAGCSSGTAGSSAAVPGPRSAVDAPGATVFSAAARRPVPELSGRTLQGSEFRLRDVAGHGVVVLNVWASWCAPCRDEAGVLAAASRDAAGVQFVGVDEGDSDSAARTFVTASGTTYPQLVDPDGVLLAKLTVLPSTGIPSTLVLDRHGRMAARVIGPLTGSDLRRLVSAVEQES